MKKIIDKGGIINYMKILGFDISIKKRQKLSETYLQQVLSEVGEWTVKIETRLVDLEKRIQRTERQAYRKGERESAQEVMETDASAPQFIPPRSTVINRDGVENIQPGDQVPADLVRYFQ